MGSTTANDVEGAIARVLAAELAAQAALQRCAVDAQQLIEQARARARRIGDRTTGRIQRLGERIEQRCASVLAELTRPLPETPLDPHDEARLRQLVAQIAAELTGDAP